MSIKAKLKCSVNEKDVENIYRSYLSSIEGASISSPHGCDGLLIAKNSIRTLLEFKFDFSLKNRMEQAIILIQCLYYIKKIEVDGDKLPTTIFVGDRNECFVLHSNDLLKYLDSQVDWSIAPSDAHKKNIELLTTISNDSSIIPFIFDIDDNFKLSNVIDKLKDLSINIMRKVRITQGNIATIFQYFNSHVLDQSCKLSSNERANLFIHILISSDENYIHPKKKNCLNTKYYGEVKVNGNQFNSFFAHFEDSYTPKQKETLTGFVDRLVEDTTRRFKGEFFTPTLFVNKAHEYIAQTFGTDWKERFVVWDCCCGTANLTRDYKFKELYLSTLESSDLHTIDQMEYNKESTKFQFDFLNENDSGLPVGLQDAIENGKEILFLINPPYATANNMGTKEGDHKGGVAKTMINEKMNDDGIGKSAQNLYAQFLYRILNYQKYNKNIKIALFSPPLFLSGGTYKPFREVFLDRFSFERGFLFEASHFSDVAKGWGISFTCFDSGKNVKPFVLDVVEMNEATFELTSSNKKEIYNTDNETSASEWVRTKLVGKEKNLLLPHLSSFVTVSTNDNQRLVSGSIGSLCILSNSVYKNSVGVSLFSSIQTQGNASISLSVLSENFYDVTSMFTARKSYKNNWINDKDEYLAPNESHPAYNQFTIDSLVYSLFNNSSQQSSLRNIEYKGKWWDIVNEWFWLSKQEMLNLAESNNYDSMYRDARTSSDRFVYNEIQKNLDKFSPDASLVLKMATNLLYKSIKTRMIMDSYRQELHLSCWDCGYAQMKEVWKEYHKEEFNAFRSAYKQLEERLKPIVVQVGFLKS